MPVIVARRLRVAGLNEVLRQTGPNGSCRGGETRGAGAWGAMRSPPLAPRLRRLPLAVAFGHEFPLARGRARLLGLAGLDREAAGAGLLIPRCAAVHTFGMRFALDLVFLDRDGRPCSVRLALPPRRLAADRRAAAVLELPSQSRVLRPAAMAEGGEFSSLPP